MKETQKFIPTDDSTTVVYTLHPNEPGLFQVHYNIRPKNNFRKPENSVVLVTSSDSSGKEDNNYFQSLGLSDGQLELGCCSNSLFMSSAQCISKLSFFPSCQWFSAEGETEFISKGVVFIGGRALNLPLSIAGIDVRSSSSSFKASLPTMSDILSERCLSSEKETFQCAQTNTTIRFGEYDVQNFLTFNSCPLHFWKVLKISYHLGFQSVSIEAYRHIQIMTSYLLLEPLLTLKIWKVVNHTKQMRRKGCCMH